MIMTATTRLVISGVRPGEIDGDATRKITKYVEYSRLKQPRFDLQFAEEVPISHSEIVPTLQHLAGLAEDALQKLAAVAPKLPAEAAPAIKPMAASPAAPRYTFRRT